MKERRSTTHHLHMHHVRTTRTHVVLLATLTARGDGRQLHGQIEVPRDVPSTELPELVIDALLGRLAVVE